MKENKQAHTPTRPNPNDVASGRVSSEELKELFKRYDSYEALVEVCKWVLNNDKPRLSVLMVEVLERALKLAEEA